MTHFRLAMRKRGTHILGSLAVAAIGLLLLVAAVLKIIEPANTLGLLDWYHFKPTHAPIALALLVAVELALGLFLVLTPANAPVRFAAIGLFVVFTVHFIIALTTADAPSRGCFGLVRIFENERNANLGGLGRNLLILSVLVFVPMNRRAWARICSGNCPAA